LLLFQESDKSKLDSLIRFTRREATRNETDLKVLRENEPTDPKFGSEPDSRPLQDYLKFGFIALDKPQGPTSHEVVSWVRKIFGSQRAGHSGTLDPMVSGVLPVGLDSATKALSALLLGPKEYISVARIHDSVPEKSIEEVLSEFVGPIYQKPPQRSSVRRMTRTREIYETELLEQSGNLLLLRTLCEAGTYLRKLIYDYGEVLKVGATMAELRRTRVCHLDERDLVRLHDLFEAKATFDETGDETKIRRVVKPIESELGFLKLVKIRDSAVDSLCHGAQLAIPGIVAFTSGLKKGELIRVLSGKGELVALSESQMDADEILHNNHGVAAITRRVIMEPGTYPKMWRKAESTSETEESDEARLKESIFDKIQREEEEEQQAGKKRIQERQERSP
jgi:H/ACA ribonucleoprotein complex subunit 4